MSDSILNEIIFEAGSGKFKGERYEEIVTSAMDAHAEEDKNQLKQILKQLKKENMTVAKKTVAKKPAVAKKAVAKKAPVKKVVKKPVVEAEKPAEEPTRKVAKKPTAAKKPVAAKPVVEKATTAKKPAVKLEVVKPTETEKKSKIERVTVEESSEPITEFLGVKVGDKINHPKNGEGEVMGFKYASKYKHYAPIVKFGDKKKTMSPYVAAANKL